jgi:hypothetical protein
MKKEMLTTLIHYSRPQYYSRLPIVTIPVMIDIRVNTEDGGTGHVARMDDMRNAYKKYTK